jgi:hypothetical protein
MLAEVEKAWEGLDSEVTEKEEQAESAEQMMAQVLETEALLGKLLCGLEPVMCVDLAHSTEDGTKESLQKHKVRHQISLLNLFTGNPTSKAHTLGRYVC